MYKHISGSPYQLGVICSKGLQNQCFSAGRHIHTMRDFHEQESWKFRNIGISSDILQKAFSGGFTSGDLCIVSVCVAAEVIDWLQNPYIVMAC